MSASYEISLPAGVERYLDDKAERLDLALWAAFTAPRLTYPQWHAAITDIEDKLARATMVQAAPMRAILGLCDRWYLATVLLRRTDLLTHGKGSAWLYDRCREVEADPDDHLDLWARSHGKSSLITFAGVAQEYLRDPDITIGLFSHTRPIAKGFLLQHKTELEQNEVLQQTYPDVIWKNPNREAPKWSEDIGICLRRKTNPKEQTIEAWGLVDGQPTSRHYRLLVYDDVVTRESVTTPEQVRKTTESFELSHNLGTLGHERRWLIGTRYTYADTYGELIARGAVKTRIHPATHNGRADGQPVLLSQESWDKLKRDQPTQYAAQHLQNPAAGADTMFQAKNLSAFDLRPLTLNVYILVDPSKGNPNRRSDRTAIAVIGVDGRGNRYLLDGYRHRMKLPERWRILKALHKHWSAQPGVQSVRVGYEQYGLQTDLESIEWRQLDEKYPFPIEELGTPRDNTRSKEDRVERLTPDFANRRFHLPAIIAGPDGSLMRWKVVDDRVEFEVIKAESKVRADARENMALRPLLAGPIKRLDENRKVYDLTRCFIEEYVLFPFGSHDDLIDAASRIYDIGAAAPQIIDPAVLAGETMADS